MSIVNIKEGAIGESKAVDFLKKNGYKILERNFKCATGEVDIIAKKKGVICFIEVKARSYSGFGSPLEAITPSKIRKIKSATQYYLHINNVEDEDIRFDVVNILGDEIELIENAF